MPSARPDIRVPEGARLRVNAIRCQAFGFCADYAPELFGLDEWGYPVVHRREIPAEQLALAYEAARRCPVRAILLEQARGASPRRGE